MRKILIITLTAISAAFIFGTVYAQDKKETPKTEHKCSCGCMDGKECTCKECKCDCGCKDGKECKCKDHKKEMKGGSCH